MINTLQRKELRKLKNWLGAYKKFTKHLEPPDSFLLWSGLWGLSAVIGRKAWVESSGEKEGGYFKVFPNIFVVLTGPPATHKTTCCNIVNAMVGGIEGIALGPNMTTKEALINKLDKSNDVFIYNNESITHSSLAITSPEWSNLMGEQDKTFCNVLCELYDCNDKFEKWTKTQGNENIENVYLTMLAGSTIKQITDCLPPSAIGGGFTSRVVFVVDSVDLAKKNPRPALNKEEQCIKDKLIEDLKVISDEIVGPFELTSGGKETFDKWYMTRVERLDMDDKFIHYCDRKPTHVIKTAMLLSVSKDSEMKIGAGEILDAIKLLNDIEPRMPEALGGVGLSLSAPVVAAIIDKMRQHRKLTEKQLQFMLWRDANKKELQDALVTLINMTPPLIIRTDEGMFVWKGGR